VVIKGDKVLVKMAKMVKTAKMVKAVRDKVNNNKDDKIFKGNVPDQIRHQVLVKTCVKMIAVVSKASDVAIPDVDECVDERCLEDKDKAVNAVHKGNSINYLLNRLWSAWAGAVEEPR